MGLNAIAPDDWDEAVEYAKGDLVLSDGLPRRALQSSVNHEPTNTADDAYWEIWLPVTLEEAAFEIIAYENSEHRDAKLLSKIAAATEWLQDDTVRQYLLGNWLQTLDSFPQMGAIKLDMTPVSSIESVSYYDTNGDLLTVDPASYWFDTHSIPPRITAKKGWPATEASRPAAVEIVFVAGSARRNAVPEKAKLAIKLLALYWYDQAEAVEVMDSVEPTATRPAAGDIPFGVFSIANQLRMSGYT